MRIVLATDGSPASRAAGVLLGQLPAAVGSEIHVVTVLGPFDQRFYAERPALERVWEVRETYSTQVLALSSDDVNGENRSITTEVRTGESAREILASAHEFGADLLVIGSRGISGIEEFFLGSVARNVAHHTKIPVLIVHSGGKSPKRVLVAFDGSNHARDAVALLQTISLGDDCEFQVTSVYRPYMPVVVGGVGDPSLIDALGEIHAEERHEIKAQLSAATESLRNAGLKTTGELRSGDPATQLIEAVNDFGADLVVLGSKGVSGVEGLLVGSVADRILSKVRCSILLVP